MKWTDGYIRESIKKVICYYWRLIKMQAVCLDYIKYKVRRQNIIINLKCLCCPKNLICLPLITYVHISILIKQGEGTFESKLSYCLHLQSKSSAVGYVISFYAFNFRIKLMSVNNIASSVKFIIETINFINIFFLFFFKFPYLRLLVNINTEWMLIRVITQVTTLVFSLLFLLSKYIYWQSLCLICNSRSTSLTLAN